MNTRRTEADFQLGQRNVLLSRAAADECGASPVFQPKSGRFRRDVVVPVSEAWVEAPIGEAWVAALRLGFRNRQPVVSELRIFPAEPMSAANTDQPLGHWSGEARGVSVKGIPPGGLTAGVLRRVRIGEWRRFLKKFLRQVGTERGEQIFSDDGLLGHAGFQAPADPIHRATRKPGPVGRDDTFYRTIAREYVAAFNDGSVRPVADVARRHPNASVNLVRQWVHRARVRGFLTPAVDPGLAGGSLTALDPARTARLRKVAANGRRRTTRPPS